MELRNQFKAADEVARTTNNVEGWQYVFQASFTTPNQTYCSFYGTWRKIQRVTKSSICNRPLELFVPSAPDMRKLQKVAAH